MADHRNPAETSEMKAPLRCMDFDERGERVGTTCQRQQEASPVKHSFKCPGGCQSGGFLYPRYKRDDGTMHFHQGIDLTPRNAFRGPQSPNGANEREAQGVRIRAVASGLVMHSTLTKSKRPIVNNAPHPEERLMVTV